MHKRDLNKSSEIKGVSDLALNYKEMGCLRFSGFGSCETGWERVVFAGAARDASNRTIVHLLCVPH